MGQTPTSDDFHCLPAIARRTSDKCDIVCQLNRVTPIDLDIMIDNAAKELWAEAMPGLAAYV